MLRTSSLIAFCALGASAFTQQAITVSGLGTTVTFSDGFLNAARTLNLRVSALPGSAVGHFRGRPTAFFPISDGELDLATAKGEIFHTGGLQLKGGSTTVRLRAFNIDTTGASPVLSGLVVANGGVVARLPLFNLDLPSGLTLPLRPRQGRVNLEGVGLRLTSQAASALNGAFGVTAFTAGFQIGSASVAARSH